MSKSVFGEMPDGTKIDLYTLESDSLKATVMTYGAYLVSVEAPDRNGKWADVTLGYDSFEPYTGRPARFFGAVVGRYANRIAHGRFSLNGKQYQLSQNEGETSLHGGIEGFERRVWHGTEIPNGVELSLVSKDGDQGYPGTMKVRVRYTLAGNALKLEYFATTDRDTVVNLTNHVYFNLAGEGQGDILNHLLTIPADRYTPSDANLIPTGEIAPVAGTPLDFRKPTTPGARIDENNVQLRQAMGYDVNYVLPENHGALQEAARLVDPQSGRVLVVRTTEPAMQLYTAQHLDGRSPGKHGHFYRKNAGLCLETQHFPNSPNQPNFPTTVLKAGAAFQSVTIFEFSTGS